MDLDGFFAEMSLTYRRDIASELFEGNIPKVTQEIINRISKKMDLSFVLAKDPDGNVCMANNSDVRSEFRQNFSAIAILDYTYARLFCSSISFAEKEYAEDGFPYPNDSETFWKLADLGSKLKQIHSLKNLKNDDFIIEFSFAGNNIVDNPRFEKDISDEKNMGRIYINKTQYFENVSETIWLFQIENYKPAQKYLNEKKGQKLTVNDIVFYQKILFALSETARLISEKITKCN